jgi:glutamine synthetase type III
MVMVKLRDYYNAYLDYYKMADEIEREQNALHEIEAECSDLDKAINALERDRKNTKEILDDKTKHYSTQSTLLAASERKLCVNKKGINGLASLNEYTNPDIFEQINEELRATCEDKKQAYIADREKTLKAELSSLKRKL